MLNKLIYNILPAPQSEVWALGERGLPVEVHDHVASVNVDVGDERHLAKRFYVDLVEAVVSMKVNT